jgi:Rrf2 family transcriptional regulator, nitric oxide-sensitive transcriptional repressor
MQLTRFTDLSMRALMYLAWQPDGVISNISEMARVYAVPENHMVKVVHHLGKIGMVKTIRGRKGGVRLGKSREEIRLGDVVRLTEPSFELVDCEGARPCPLRGGCELKSVLDDAVNGFILHLNRYTLADVTRGDFGRRVLMPLPQVLGDASGELPKVS